MELNVWTLCVLLQIPTCRRNYIGVILLPFCPRGVTDMTVSLGGRIEHMWLSTLDLGALSLHDVNCIGLSDMGKGPLLFYATSLCH